MLLPKQKVCFMYLEVLSLGNFFESRIHVETGSWVNDPERDRLGLAEMLPNINLQMLFQLPGEGWESPELQIASRIRGVAGSFG